MNALMPVKRILVAWMAVPAIVLCAVSGVCRADQQPSNAAQHTRAFPAAVEKILQERLQVLVEILQLQQAAYRTGEATFDAVSSAQKEVLAARLELAKSPKERIAIRRAQLQIAREIEELTQRLAEANQATRVDVLSAKADRLRAEADLKHEELPVED